MAEWSNITEISPVLALQNEHSNPFKWFTIFGVGFIFHFIYSARFPSHLVTDWVSEWVNKWMNESALYDMLVEKERTRMWYKEDWLVGRWLKDIAIAIETIMFYSSDISEWNSVRL